MAKFQSCWFITLARRLMILLCIWSLAACSDRQALSPMLENYQYRLGNVFEFTPQNSWQVPDTRLLPAYPSRRNLQLSLSSMSVNLLEFLRLSRCELQRLIGERNSSLGKHMADSQAWLYHRRFIELAEVCHAQLLNVGNTALANKVYTAWQVKLADLDRGRWNASIASHEFQHLFSLAAPPLSLSEARADSAALQQALAQLYQQLFESSAEAELNSATLESYYAVIGSDKYMGRLLRSQALLIEALNELTDAMQAAASKSPLCPNGQLTPRGRVMQKVFLRFYIGEVQPYLAGIYRQGQDLQKFFSTYLHYWKDKLPNQALQAYWHQAWDETNPQSTWRQFMLAIDLHTQAWQEQLQGCGLRPGHTAGQD